MSLPARILIGLALLAIAFTGGWRVCADHRDAQLLEQERADRKLADALRGSVERLARRSEAARAARADNNRIITREVIRYEYLTPATDRCSLPGTWRLLHDAAATGNPAAATSMATANAAPIADAAALVTVTDNYAACREVIEQVRGWQEWCAVVECAGP